MTSRSVLCLIASLLGTDLAIAQTTIGSSPAAVLSFDVPAGLSGMSCPLIPAELASGTIVANTTNQITFAVAAGAIGPQLTAGGAYYVEILSGPYAGERLDLDTTATIAAGGSTITLSFAASSQSTLGSLGFSLAGQQGAVRAHLTLAALASAFSPALTGSDDPALADGVRIYDSDGFTFYHLKADGVSWATAGTVSDQRNKVIPPDVSIALHLRSGPRAFIQTGLVRATPFRKNLQAGYQSFATGYPVDLTLTEAGAYVDAAQSSALRWTGSNNAAAADTAQVFDVSAQSFLLYQLRSDGTSWRRLGRTDNVADAPLLRIDACVVLQRTTANASYRINPPFTL